jgi:hypothetical protein
LKRLATCELRRRFLHGFATWCGECVEWTSVRHAVGIPSLDTMTLMGSMHHAVLTYEILTG